MAAAPPANEEENMLYDNFEIYLLTLLMEGFNKDINTISGIFHRVGGGSTHSTKIINFLPKNRYPSN